MRRGVEVVFEVMYLSSKMGLWLVIVRQICVEVDKPLSGTRRYWTPSTGSKPLAMLVRLDAVEYWPSEDRVDDDVLESIEESRECTMTFWWAELRCDMFAAGRCLDFMARMGGLGSLIASCWAYSRA